VEILQQLAHEEGRTVITVIHQPSWRIFTLFDALVLLKDGRVVYDGPALDVQAYFSKIGFDAPPNENPMDYFFDILQESGAAGDEKSASVSDGTERIPLPVSWPPALEHHVSEH
jgi:ABC-type multidrug transport system ATPase subunit